MCRRRFRVRTKGEPGNRGHAGAGDDGRPSSGPARIVRHSMHPLSKASLAERTAEGARFVFDGGWQCRIFVLADDLVRVLFVRPEGLSEPRTWMVAPGGEDVPWEG